MMMKDTTSPLATAGAGLGLSFNPLRRIVPTMQSHRLIELAQHQANLPTPELMERNPQFSKAVIKVSGHLQGCDQHQYWHL